MNEVADGLANRARRAAENIKDLPFSLFGEMLVGLRVAGIPCTGRYKAALVRAGTAAQLSSLRSLEHQGQVAKAAGEGPFLALCGAVSASRDPWLMRFSTLACTAWLPSERVLLSRSRQSNNDGRGPSCKLCYAAEETNEHALSSCPFPPLARLRASVVEAALSAILRPRTDRPPPRPTCYGPGRIIPAWFDPQSQHTIRICPLVSPQIASQLLSRPFHWASMLGIAPPGIDEVLRWERHPDGGWRDRGLAGSHEVAEELRTILARGALRGWITRCRAMNRWWRSPAACDARAQAVLGVSNRAASKARIRATSAIPPPPPRSSYAKSRLRRKADRRAVDPGFHVTDPGDLDFSITFRTTADRSSARTLRPSWF
jgi:hypothetical protein